MYLPNSKFERVVIKMLIHKIKNKCNIESSVYYTWTIITNYKC